MLCELVDLALLDMLWCSFTTSQHHLIENCESILEAQQLVSEIQVELKVVFSKLNGGAYMYHDQIDSYKLLYFEIEN